MIFDIRYHIFTITAIFAALGIGILVGTSIIGPEGLINEQHKLISNIEEDIEKIRGENLALRNDVKELKQELVTRKENEEKILSLFLNDGLVNKHYLIYGENNEDLSRMKKLFQLAGAEIKIISHYNQLAENANYFNKLIIRGEENSLTEKNNFEQLKTQFKDVMYFTGDNLNELLLTVIVGENW